MLKKISLTIAFVSAFMFTVGTVNTFAKNPDCPDACKCPDTVKCDPKCNKSHTNTCICKH